MNKIFKYTLYLPLCGMLLQSCAQDIELDPSVNTEGNEIVFQTNSPTTRGLINNLGTLGTKITLYGYHDGTVLASTKKPLNGKSLTYMNERWAVVDDNDTLKPNTPITYFWEGTGTYRFYGWLKADNQILAHSYNESTKVLTVSEELNSGYKQLDFLYSAVDERTLTNENMASEKSRPVALNMQHLFSAFSIGIENLSEKDITIKEVTLRHIKTQGSASVNFNPSVTRQVTYSLSEQTAPETSFLSYSKQDGYVVKAGDLEHNIFVPGTKTENKYYLVWPQTLPEISFNTEKEEEEAEDEEFTLVMKYTVEGDDDAVITKRMKIPSSSLNWEAGKLYSYNVQIADKIVTLNYTIQEWDYIDSDVNFKDGAVTVASPIDWENGEKKADGTFEKNTCIVDTASHKVFVEGIKPVEATFGFSTPEGGQWYVSLVGDVDAFEIENNLGPIDGNLHRIMIKPKILSPERDYSVKLQFVVMTANGDTHLANLVQTQGHSEIYSIVLQKAN